jgi:predicted unusual protein kinase regulating ubiquinone biosynthesis (AarF/ABC1/UbiB family)
LVSGLFPNQSPNNPNQNLPSKADFNALKEIGELFVKLNQHLTGYTNLTEEEIVFYLQELKRLAKENEHLRLNI